MSKPWKSQPGGNQLEAYVGAFGIKTSLCESTDELILVAARLFDLEAMPTVQMMAEEITALGKKKRSELARQNLRHLPAELMGSGKSPASQTEKEMLITQMNLGRMMAASRPQMIDGTEYDIEGELDIDPAQLLRKVVSAVIASGYQHILWEFPEVLAFFKARIPRPEEVEDHHSPNRDLLAAKDRHPNLRSGA